MNLNDVKLIIENEAQMFDDLITEDVISVAQAELLAPIVLDNVLKNNSVVGDYNS